GLGVLTLLMCFLIFAALLVRGPRYLERYAAYSVITTGLSLFVVWSFWKGKNWARWSVLAGSVLAFYNLTSFRSAEGPHRVYLVAQASLALWMLVWLNTQAVRDYFERRVESGAA